MTEKPPKAAPKNKSSKLLAVKTYAVQCSNCMKWRSIGTEEEYMDIRSKVEPFLCGDGKSNVSCEDPADVEMKVDASHMWVNDKDGIPRTPDGFKRIMVPRSDYSKIDVYYITPMGKRVKCFSELKAFKETNPEYKNLSLSDFNFSSPKVVEGTISKDSTGGNA
ncbi:methyl-CpG-binding domain-containing protein 4-like [Tripterygium wilfordii]|uniref:Methyl-CpG-binding domain-containing protein 4-like n=1 Tax=Tripterygium wilfordii TaxID=458696 RepID=A0A7J7CKB5_TRIWF|nr:methyl-CpG-binding domain-containing protein 4-like isoform X2 [Tripterygium wilfordii]KAF5734505.1 methyl-CpG-binding domain-containing protein 4-like [Tripterygium wilfordii]